MKNVIILTFIHLKLDSTGESGGFSCLESDSLGGILSCGFYSEYDKILSEKDPVPLL